MQEKNQTVTVQGMEYGEGRLTLKPSKVATFTPRYVKNCPWEDLGHLMNCRDLPANYICGDCDCWTIGIAVKGFNLFQLSEYDFKKFVQAAVLVQPKVIYRLLDKYNKPPDPPDCKA